MGFRILTAGLLLCLPVTAMARQARVAVLRDDSVHGAAGAQRMVRGFLEANLAVAGHEVVAREAGAAPAESWLQCLAAAETAVEAACSGLPALNVDAVAAVFVDRLGTRARVVVVSAGGAVVGVKQLSFRRQLAVFDGIERAASRFGQALVSSLGADAAHPSRRDHGWAVVGGAALAAGVGGAMGVVAISDYRTLTSPGRDGPRDFAHATALRESVAFNSTAAIVIGSAAVVATGIGLSIVAAPFGTPLTTLTLAPGPGGAVLAGRFP